MNPVFKQARLDKDKNFDGRFFFGVKSTGIVCRPSCPAPEAKEENVVYFNTLFEALEQHFRPCLRCRPDINIEYHWGNPTSASILDTALNMIYEGFLNYHSLKELSAKLNISDRHLRQIFMDNLGAPPVKILTFHKILFAKKLLLYSNHSITEIAFASGFRSLRQFNDVFKNTFGISPSQMRIKLQESPKTSKTTTLLLKYQKPFDYKQILNFMRERAIAGVETITDSKYSRTFRTQTSNGWFIVNNNPEKSALELHIDSTDIRCFMEISNRVRKMFDLNTDFTHINDKFSNDPILSKGMENGHVPRLPAAFDPFEFTVRAILGQQITVRAATTLAGRVAEKAAIQTTPEFPEGLNYFFPNPSELIELDIDGLGITKIRQQTIKTVTQSILDEKLELSANQDFDTFHQQFSALKGIGDWTVNYVAMRGLGIIDSFPAGDLGVIKALAADGTKPSIKEINSLAEQWRPYRAYAALCLWNS